MLLLGLMGSPALMWWGSGLAGLGARRSGSSAVSWSSSSLCFFRRCGSSPEHEAACAVAALPAGMCTDRQTAPLKHLP